MFWPQAEQKTRTDLVLDQIVLSMGLQVDDEEIDKELETILPHTKAKSVKELRNEMTDSHSLAHFESYMKRQKAVKAIVDSAKITLVDELTVPEGTEPEESDASQPATVGSSESEK
jgi:FKBP-type peptidyl-prolyl cis-trans isomerase (trigger factor)